MSLHPFCNLVKSIGHHNVVLVQRNMGRFDPQMKENVFELRKESQQIKSLSESTKPVLPAQCHNPPAAVDDSHDAIGVEAHLEHESLCEKKNVVISDGGADSCVLGRDAHIVSCTSGPAISLDVIPTLPGLMRSQLETGHIKTKANDGVPVISKIDEAPINTTSSVTILSECQVKKKTLFVTLLQLSLGSMLKETREHKGWSQMIMFEFLLLTGEASWALRCHHAET